MRDLLSNLVFLYIMFHYWMKATWQIMGYRSKTALIGKTYSFPIKTSGAGYEIELIKVLCRVCRLKELSFYVVARVVVFKTDAIQYFQSR